MGSLPSFSFLANMASMVPQYQPFQTTMHKTKHASNTKAPASHSGTSNHSQPASTASSAPINIPSSSNSSNPNSLNSTPASSPPSGTLSNMCEVCHIRPKFVDGSKTHAYCGRSCASRASATAAGNCVICHVRPRYFDGSHTHPYCGKSCAKKAESTPSRQSGVLPNPNGTCQLPGCKKPVFKTTGGFPSKYCSIAHKELAERTCLLCRKAPKQGDRHFCGLACAEEAQRRGPMILEIPEDHVTFQDVEAQFKASWRHQDKICPTVRHIYKIVADQVSSEKYDAYRDAVEARGHFVQDGRSSGNENRRWHGTTRECRLGDSGQTQFCSSSSCSLCCIMRTSYDLNLWGKKTGWGRFGAGIYTSSTSSKSNDYSSSLDPKTSLKAILLNKIVVGKGYKMTQDNTSLTAPPAGFDSVLAEKGSRLNHDELVVYVNEAIRPSYLVMYDAL